MGITSSGRRGAVRLLLAGGIGAMASWGSLPGAWAQESGEAGATPGGQMWIPGMPAPQLPQMGSKSHNAVDGSGALKGDGASARGTGQAVVEQEAPAEIAPTGDGERRDVPDSHLVRKGDTLWGVSQSYFGSPWKWPRLWALNPLVTNPHWIYPGDVLRLRPTEEQVAAPPPPPAPAVEGIPPALQVVKTAGAGFTLRQTSFVDNADYKSLAKIVGSKEEKILLATMDEAYVEYPAADPLKPGERYSVYRVVSPLRLPGKRKPIASIVQIMGEIEVRSVTPKRIAKVVIVDATAPIERGDKVGPLRRQFKVVDPVADRVNTDAMVLGTVQPSEISGEATIVYIDRGKDDGLEVGNRLVMVQRGDGYQSTMGKKQKDNEKFPREVMGEILIVDTRSKTSTAIVTRAHREMRTGDRLEARVGY